MASPRIYSPKIYSKGFVAPTRNLLEIDHNDLQRAMAKEGKEARVKVVEELMRQPTADAHWMFIRKRELHKRLARSGKIPAND